MMDNFTPSPDFEKKVQAAASAPSADPEFVNRLRAQVAAVESGAVKAREAARPSLWERLAHGLHLSNHARSTQKGNFIMRTRWFFPALAAVGLMALAAFFVFNPATPVSAQQILSRAAQAQSAQGAAQGVWHLRFEDIQNLQALPGDQTSMKIVEDQYYDLSSNRYRIVSQNATGQVVEVSGSDGSTSYSSYGPAKSAADQPLKVYRETQDVSSGKSVVSGSPAQMSQSIFDQFNNNPRVRLEGKTTWTDGSPVYVLVDENYQLDGQDGKALTGVTTATFDAKTYLILAYQTTIHKDGQDIIVQSTRFLKNEILPANTPVVWDFSDLKGIVISDAPKADAGSGDVQNKTISQQELAQYGEAYVLSPLPAGFSEVIDLHLIPGQDPTFEIHYTGPAKETLNLQAVGSMDEGFVASSFYDGSYKTASGLVLHYSPSSHDANTGGVAGMLMAPDGTGYLLDSSLPRDQVQALIETLVRLK